MPLGAVGVDTMGVSTTSVTIGTVLGCNDSQIVSVSTSGGQIKFNASVTYGVGETKTNWVYVRDLTTGASTNGSSAIASTVPAGGVVNLLIGLNNTSIGAIGDNAKVVLTSTTPAGQTINITVTFQPYLGCAGYEVSTGNITVTPASLTFNLPQGSAGSADLTIRNNTGKAITFTVNSDDDFLTFSSISNTIQPGQIIGVVVTASAKGSLMPGNYPGGLIIRTSLNDIVPISVLMIVTNSQNGTGPLTGIKASPGVLNFFYTPGQVYPPPQSIQVSNFYPNTPPILSAVAVTQYNGPGKWISTTTTNGSVTPFGIGVSVDPSLLSPGVVYQASIVITPFGGPPVSVYVSLTITGSPVVSAGPGSLTFNWASGPAPAPQSIQVSGGGAGAQFQVMTSGDSWLKVSPVAMSGVTPVLGSFALTVNADPTGLPNGIYQGSVTVWGVGFATGTSKINVTFNVGNVPPPSKAPAITQVTNAASYSEGAVSPGEMIALFGDSSSPLGPDVPVQLTPEMIVNNQLPTTMGDVQVLFNGVEAPLVFVSATQINCIVPYEIGPSGTVLVQVKYHGKGSDTLILKTTTAQPGIFTAAPGGRGQGAVVQYDSQGAYQGVNSASNPAQRGGTIVLYVTGEGKPGDGAVTGHITSDAGSVPQFAPTVLIDGQPADVVFFGEAPGFAAGIMQVNVRVPQGVRIGSDLFLSISVNETASQAGVTIATK